MVVDIAIVFLAVSYGADEMHRRKMAEKSLWAGICGILQKCESLYSVDSQEMRSSMEIRVWNGW